MLLITRIASGCSSPPSSPWFHKPHPLYLVPSLNTVPSTSSPVSPHHPFHDQQFRQKLSLPKIASPANHRNGFWAGSQVPFNHTAKTEATGSHQPTYLHVCMYLHSYIHTRSKTDNVGVWSMSPLSSCAVQHTPHLPTYVRYVCRMEPQVLNAVSTMRCLTINWSYTDGTIEYCGLCMDLSFTDYVIS